MHDPMVVAFNIVRPWPARFRHNDAGRGDPRWKIRHDSRFWTVAGRGLYWPAMVTVWHREPDGRDSGEVCSHHTRWQDTEGQWHSKPARWRWHVHHWRVQLPPLQELRRRLLTRCEWCGGRSRRRDPVNYSHSWDHAKQPWWRGERGLYHGDCSTVWSAHQTCTCPDPLLDHDGYGKCALCGRFRSYGATPEWLVHAERVRESVPVGGRDRSVAD